MSLGRRWLAAALPLLIGAAPPQSLGDNSAAADVPMVRPADYKLVWSDEFDKGRLPDPAKWRYDISRNHDGWYNAEQQYYAAARPENARIENGALVIEARKERLTTAADYGGQDYTSARIDTQGLAKWTYGFVEIRAKLPCGRGTWPGLWLLGADGSAGWPALGEIDVMEQVGWDANVIHGTIHTAAYNHTIGTQKGADLRVADSCTAFHTYQLDWTKDRILIGVDGHAYMRFANDGRGDAKTWPFDKPQYLIFNLAIGGSWGGQQGIDPAAFPARMTIDYVRVWQKRD